MHQRVSVDIESSPPIEYIGTDLDESCSHEENGSTPNEHPDVVVFALFSEKEPKKYFGSPTSSKSDVADLFDVESIDEFDVDIAPKSNTLFFSLECS